MYISPPLLTAVLNKYVISLIYFIIFFNSHYCKNVRTPCKLHKVQVFIFVRMYTFCLFVFVQKLIPRCGSRNLYSVIFAQTKGGIRTLKPLLFIRLCQSPFIFMFSGYDYLQSNPVVPFIIHPPSSDSNGQELFIKCRSVAESSSSNDIRGVELFICFIQ